MEHQRVTPSQERINALEAVLFHTTEGRQLKRDLIARGINTTGNRAPALGAQTGLTLSFNNLSLADDICELCQMARPNDTPLESKQRADAIRHAMLASFGRDIEAEPVQQKLGASELAHKRNFVAAESQPIEVKGANPARQFAAMAERPAGVGVVPNSLDVGIDMAVLQFVSTTPAVAPSTARPSALAPH
jgi:hypothetical protein